MIYFDNAATTKVDEEVIIDIIDSLKNDWANPSSISEQGLSIKRKIEHARKQIANYINAEPEEIIFTASGSEANNLAIKGFLDANKNFNCIISTEIEHPSIYNICEYLKKKEKYKIEYMPVNYIDGLIYEHKFYEVINLLSSNNYLCFVSIMMANNEIGTIQPIRVLAKTTHEYQGVIHTDATQAFGKIPIDVKHLDVDLMSVSLHKCGLPKGIGFLYKKKNVLLSPIIHGGHQEMDMRAGTENSAYIIAAGNQIERMSKKGYSNYELKNYLLNKICESIKDINIYLNGDMYNRIPNHLSLTFSGINIENLITLLDMKGIQVSAGSACCSGDKTPSRVLKAIGLSDEEAFSTMRISIGENTTIEECDEFVKVLKECLIKLKSIE